jgi:hypothetical protein
MKFSPWFMITALAAVLVLAGCSAPGRAMVEIHPGDTPENVEARLGRPDRQQERTGVHVVAETVWIYTNLPASRPVATGWNEVLVAGTSDQHGKVIQQPVTRDVALRQERQEMHVVFTSGRVSSVEYPGK